MMQYSHSTSYRQEVNKHSLYDRVVFLLYTMYFVFAPFYFWTSGLPQISDLILVLLVVFYAIKKNMNFRYLIETRLFLMIGLTFVAYLTCVNLTWTMILNVSGDMGVRSLFYLYNFLCSALAVILYTDYRERILEVTNRAVLMSVAIQVIVFLFGGGFTGARMTGNFNNPNQLGYYALMVASIQIYVSCSKKTSTRSVIMGLVLSFVLVIASLSSTAIVSYMGQLVLFTLTKNRRKRRKYQSVMTGVFFLAAIAFVCMAFPIRDSKMIQSLETRARTVEGKLSHIVQERGYDRIAEYPEYWLFGAGEGEYLLRFGQTKEFHSTLGNIMVSYGIFGLLLFLLFMYLALKNDRFKSWYIVISVMLYGLTHNGIRNSMLWMLLGLLSTGASSMDESKKG